MIKFFRQIRQRLLTDLPAGQAGNKFSKYLLYAIGEIVLVVIGILIALSINNQNQNRKNDDLVAIYKSELLNDLALDLNHFEFHYNLAAAENERIDSIRIILQNPNANSDTLNNLIKKGLPFLRREDYIMLASTEYPEINNNTFSSLQNSGQITLLDIKLQEELVSFYGYTKKYSFMTQEMLNSKNRLYFNYTNDFPMTHTKDFNIVNSKMYAEVLKNVDWNRVQINYITLLNSYYELNLKTMFFNSMRLYKTPFMIDYLESEKKK